MNQFAWHAGLFALMALMLCGCNKAPYSSPTALRDTNAYFEAIARSAPTLVDPLCLEQVDVNLEGETLVITRSLPDRDQPSGSHLRALKQLAMGEKLEGDGAAFEAVAISVSGPGMSRTSTNDSRYVPVDSFAPDGVRLSNEQLKQLGLPDSQLKEYIDEKSYTEDLFPELRVWFGSREQPPAYISPVGCFDARTKSPLANGFSYAQISRDHPGYVELGVQAWHSTPIDLVMDVELDGKTVIQTNAIVGMTLPVAGGFVRLVGIWDGENRNSWDSRSGSKPGTQVIRMGVSKPEGETRAFAVFLTQPRRLSFDCALLDAQGNESGSEGGRTFGGIRIVRLKDRAEDVKWIRFTAHTNHHRVVVRIPPLPNPPAASQSPANLFDVRVPLVKFDREYAIREFLGGLTQMKFRYPQIGDTMPTNLFPMSLTNVTPADLLAIYRRNMTNTCTVVVDDQKHEIRIEPTLMEKTKRWVEQKLKL